jgi:hypothetical protein
MNTTMTTEQLDQKLDDFTILVASGLDPLTAYAALDPPDEPRNEPRSLGCGVALLILALLAVWFLIC